MSGKMLKQNAVRSQNVKLKCREFSTLQKREIKMQRKISVLQYLFDYPATTNQGRKSYLSSLFHQ